MRPPRGLSPEEAALWRKVASTVRPLAPQPKIIARAPLIETPAIAAIAEPIAPPPRRVGRVPPPLAPRPVEPRKPDPNRHGLDGGWERRLARGLVHPDFTLDLHGATLDMAYVRLANGLAQARAMGARVVLLIAGRHRPVEAADRGRSRGAIRAKVTDWIAASEHAGDIAAIRTAHRRHGGPGALYLILKRRR